MAVQGVIVAAAASAMAILSAVAPTVFGSPEAEVLKRFAPMEAHIDQHRIDVPAQGSVVICAQTYPFAPPGFRFRAKYGHTQLVDKTGYDRIHPRRCAKYTAPAAPRSFTDRVDIVLRGEVLDTAVVTVQATSL